MTIRPLRTIAEFREVYALESEVWGYGSSEDAVSIPVFVATIKRGGILLGAYDGTRLAGFVYSIVGLKDGRPMQWSHMLAVRPEYRAAGIGRALKIEQRRASLATGIDLMEWTCDPLVAVNAHLNLRRLGAVVREYVVDAYGDSVSPLHRGAPTDRFVAEWWLRSPRVEAALGRTEPVAAVREGAFPGVVRVNTIQHRGGSPACIDYDLERREPDLAVAIPAAFTDMLARDPALALDWRLATRAVFTRYFTKGYQAVDFAFEGGVDRGVYLLRKADAVA